LNSAVFIALLSIVIGTIINVGGVRLMSFINNIGVAAEIVGMFVFALVLLIFFNHQSLGFLFTGPTPNVAPAVLANNLGVPGAQWTPPISIYFGAFAAAMFMSLFVIYGFDTAGTLGEETRDPQRNAPRGVLWAIGLSSIAGILFLGGTILSIKDLPRIENIAAGLNPNIPFTGTLPTIITDALGTNWGDVYLVVVLIAVCVCTLAIQSATIRLMFSMGRDGRLPFGSVWGSVNPVFRTPLWAGVAVMVLSALPFIYSTAIGVIVTGATGLIYTAYFMNNIATLGARMRGWPRVKAPFSLGQWGILVNIVALIYGGVMIINFLWFGGLRNIYTNPVMGTAFPAWVNIPVLGGTPIFEFSLVVLFGIGAIYWFGFKRRAVIAGGEKRAEALSD
jgi:amino acid transporter